MARVAFQVLWVSSALLVTACRPSSQELTLRFRALVGNAPFALDRAFSGVGLKRGPVRFSDLRLFVSRIRLRTKTGAWVRFALINDVRTQDEHAALLDFGADSSSRRGDVGIVGRVPPGTYTALAFDLGIPFAQNHQDAARARPPFDTTSMFWGWRSGYKFLRLEGQTLEEAPHKFAVHIGSAGCHGAATPIDVPTACAQPNRFTFRFPAFDPRRDAISLRVDRLLAGLLLHGTSPDNGCESDPNDADCESVFEALRTSSSSRAQATLFERGER